MRIVMFCHSLASCWNHGNAHFLRGIARELLQRGHQLAVFEPGDGWSRTNLVRDQGPAAPDSYNAAYPELASTRYSLGNLDLGGVLQGADLVLVHEWNEPELVARIGERRAAGGRYSLLFHDTHHRSVSDPAAMQKYDLRYYDGVLAFGGVIRDIYLRRGWTRRAWVWHEAADISHFRPLEHRAPEGDLVWIGNWGEGERAEELNEFLVEPVRRLGLRARVYGVRYPLEALSALRRAGIEYGGWLPNHRAPEVYSRFRMTVHVPRRHYARQLPGIPTIRIFEALACGIPLVSAPWQDSEGLFTPGADFLVARNGAEMAGHLRSLLEHPALGASLAAHGRRTIEAQHTCAHRVNELLAIHSEIRQAVRPSHAEVSA